MDHEHFMRAKLANGVNFGRYRPTDGLFLAQAATMLGGRIQRDVELLLVDIARLIDACEAGETIPVLAGQARVVAGSSAVLIGTGYRIAAATTDGGVDELIARVLAAGVQSVL